MPELSGSTRPSVALTAMARVWLVVPTLPLTIYTMVKIAVTPEVNALSTLLMLLTLTLIVVAGKVAPDVLRGKG